MSLHIPFDRGQRQNDTIFEPDPRSYTDLQIVSRVFFVRLQMYRYRVMVMAAVKSISLGVIWALILSLR